MTFVGHKVKSIGHKVMLRVGHKVDRYVFLRGAGGIKAPHRCGSAGDLTGES
jgi:hypothetical protein